MGEVARVLHVLAMGAAGSAPAVVANARAPHDRQPPCAFACSDTWCGRAPLSHFGIRSAACFVFGNGFSSGGVMPDHAGEQWRASIAEK
ncbi:hypothetical protein DZA55_03845 [Xanthomonas oryzae pv. oryzae]|nr:hypothetical protein DZA55_03845 [Xanthomonas oryzae pv. oryzae]QBO07170.1 hypothetical protein EBA22_17955 [Xanthomonas oryzae pv. oryzae]QBO10944.1 hypothetical protein EBA23_17965 [Xanthomonas oryzae pv. oryzae]QBO14725.1 hypothetical protein EBA24_17940 [Xanthomonas oryzae pv. oryzae]QBO18532.1 hypothetical protein EBA25_17970 [Xanthomonas oryzae pv. oryzae]